MASPHIRDNTKVASMLREFDERLRLARATELASCNRLLEAKAMLCQEGASKVTVAELDLLARIHVQQGCFEDARRLWKRALTLDEGSREKFEECLRVLGEYSLRQMKTRMIKWWATCVLLISSLAMGIWVLFRFAAS